MEKILVKTLYEDENNILNHNVIIDSKNNTSTQFLLTIKDANISVEIKEEDLKDTIINLKASWEDWEKEQSRKEY